MNQTPTDATTARSRGELLGRADAAIAAAERQLFSARRPFWVAVWSMALLLATALPSMDGFDTDLADETAYCGWILVWWLVAQVIPLPLIWRHVIGAVVFFFGSGVTVSVIGDDADDTATRIAFIAVWSVVAAVCVVRSWQYIWADRRWEALIASWVSARREPTLRDLDEHDVVVETATVHDVRDWAEYDEAVSDIALRHQLRLQTLPVLKPTFVLMVSGMAGFVVMLVLALIDPIDDSWDVATFLAALAAFVPFGHAIGVMWRTQLARNGEFTRVGTERILYALRRAHTAGGPEPERPGRPRIAQIVVGLIASGAMAVLVGRALRSGGLALVVSVIIVLVVAVIVFVRMWLRGRRPRIFPLDGIGPSILQEPSRRVELSWGAGGVTIADAAGHAETVVIPRSGILGVEPLNKMSTLESSGFGIVTTEAPVVVLGRHLDEHPAIVELRRWLTSRRPLGDGPPPLD